jgi:YD repeat-containing protein
MEILITTDLLKKLGACEDAIEFIKDFKLEGYPFDKLDKIKGDYHSYIRWIKRLENIKIENNVLSYVENEVLDELTFNELTFDDKGNLIRNRNDEYYDERYVYDGNNLIFEYMHDEKASEQCITVMGKDIKYKSTNNSYHLIEYDDNNNEVFTKDNRNSLTVTTRKIYDDNNRLSKLIKSNRSTISYYYDKNGNLIEAIDDLGRKTSYKYNENNQIISELSSNGFSSSWEYDKDGNLISFTDMMGDTTKYEYDENGMKTKQIWIDSDEDFGSCVEEYIKTKDEFIIKINGEKKLEVPLKYIKEIK